MRKTVKMFTQHPNASNEELIVEMLKEAEDRRAPGMLIAIPEHPRSPAWIGAYNIEGEELYRPQELERGESHPVPNGLYGFQRLVNPVLREHKALEGVPRHEALYQVLVELDGAHDVILRRLIDRLESDSII